MNVFEVEMTIIVVMQLVYNVFVGFEIRRQRNAELSTLRLMLELSNNQKEFYKQFCEFAEMQARLDEMLCADKK